MHLTHYIARYIFLNLLKYITPYTIGSMTQLASPAEEDHLPVAVDAPCIVNSNRESYTPCSFSSYHFHLENL